MAARDAKNTQQKWPNRFFLYLLALGGTAMMALVAASASEVGKEIGRVIVRSLGL